MRKLVFLFTMLALFVACSDDDDKGNDLPIKGLEIPKFENPVKPGESITIKGEGFTKTSEIWFRQIISKATENTDVRAAVTDVSSTGITFMAPEVYGNQSVLLKENGKEYELGKMTFEEQPEESGDIEILPKRVKKVVYYENKKASETYEYTYNSEKKIGSIKVTKHYNNNRTENMTYTYSTDKITVKTTGGEDEEDYVFNLKNGKVSSSKSTYTDMDEVYADNFVYTYAGEYMSKVEGSEKTEDEKMNETFSFIQGKLMQYTYKALNYNYSDIVDYNYGNQLNNLNIDLFTFISSDCMESESVIQPFLLGIAGNRSQYLPSSMKWTTEDEEDGKEVSEYKFSYKMNGDYITEMLYIDEEEEEEWRYEIFYED